MGRFGQDPRPRRLNLSGTTGPDPEATPPYARMGTPALATSPVGRKAYRVHATAAVRPGPTRSEPTGVTPADRGP
jgi:hypothetical protein